MAKWHQEQVDANIDVIKARRRVSTLEPEWRFAMPTGITFDRAKSRLLVTDTQRGRIQIYSKGARLHGGAVQPISVKTKEGDHRPVAERNRLWSMVVVVIVKGGTIDE